MSLQTIDFKDTEADLAALGRVCRELEDRGLPPNEAAAHVLASMANQAISNGMDAREAIDALHQVINGKQQQAAVPATPTRKVVPLTPQQAEEIRAKVKFLQNFLLYYDMILCSEIQRYAYKVKDVLKDKGMYRHELKRFVNALLDEARKLQMRVKDNDRIIVLKWCSRMDPKCVFAKQYQESGASIVNRFVLAFLKEFRKEWAVVELDCRTVAKRASAGHPDIVGDLLKLEALSNTGIELFDTCVKKMKALVAGHGTSSITKSTHHESMRCAVWNLLRKLGINLNVATDTEREYSRKHLAAMHTKMAVIGMGDFFQHEFDKLSEEFADYMVANIYMKMKAGKVGMGEKRFVLEKLGTKQRTKKFFVQLAAIPLCDEEDMDVIDVMECISSHNVNHKEIDRFRKFCINGTKFELPESEDKQEQRMLRILARRNNYMLPDDILRVMIMKHKTKKELVDRLSVSGFELAPTLRRVRKMKLAEIKQL